MVDHRLDFWSVSDHFGLARPRLDCALFISLFLFFFLCCRSVTRALFHGPMLISFFQIGGPMFLKHSFSNIRWSSVGHSHQPSLVDTFFRVYVHHLVIFLVISFVTFVSPVYFYFLWDCLFCSVFYVFLVLFVNILNVDWLCCTLLYFWLTFLSLSFFCSNLPLSATHALAIRSFFLVLQFCS